MNLNEVIPQSQYDDVTSQDYCDIDWEFLGFTEIYEALSRIIPVHFTVIDLGCAYAPQSFYFQDHKAYIGVDYFTLKRFHARNTQHLLMTIETFIDSEISKYDLDETFAICSYVPSSIAAKQARMTFPNIFTFYPSFKNMADFFAGAKPKASIVIPAREGAEVS